MLSFAAQPICGPEPDCRLKTSLGTIGAAVGTGEIPKPKALAMLSVGRGRGAFRAEAMPMAKPKRVAELVNIMMARLFAFS